MSKAADSARSRILGKIRKSLGVTSKDEARAGTVRERLESHPANLVPARALKPRDEQVALLAEMLEGQGTTVTRAKDAAELPGIVADYLRENNLPAQVRTGADTLLAGLPWETAPSLERRDGPADAQDAVSMTRAVTGAAETGTLFLTSGPENPTTLNFLPETHIAVIRAEDVRGSYEEAWDRLRERYGARTLPRAVNMISGPSRTADIEQTIIMGAHGPRRLHVIIVG